MRHIYIRGIIGLIWLVAVIVCGVSGNSFTGVENIFLYEVDRNEWDSAVASIVEMSYNWLYMKLWVT